MYSYVYLHKVIVPSLYYYTNNTLVLVALTIKYIINIIVIIVIINFCIMNIVINYLSYY